MDLIFNQDNQTWSVVSEGVDAPLLKMNNDGTASLYMPDGTTMNVTLDQQGKIAACETLMSNTYAVR